MVLMKVFSPPFQKVWTSVKIDLVRFDWNFISYNEFDPTFNVTTMVAIPKKGGGYFLCGYMSISLFNVWFRKFNLKYWLISLDPFYIIGSYLKPKGILN